MARWGCRVLGILLVACGGMLLVGCTTGRGVALLSPSESLLADITPVAAPRLARAQVAEPRPLAAPLSVPASPVRPAAASSPVSAPIGTQQASLVSKGELRVRVRAWVNGKPIFDDEVAQMLIPKVRGLERMPEPQRSEKLADVFNKTLDELIDQEVMYQDAVKKLEKNNPRALDKLKDYVNNEFEKQLTKMHQAGVPEDQVKEIEHTARKLMERNLISTEYARNRIVPYLQSIVSLEQIGEYYDAHKNEYRTVDKVHWQDVFIAVGPKHPTLADAKRFATELVAKCRTPDDFTKLLEFDDGDSKFRGGDGLGRLRGEVKPAELEAHLFDMKDGQIGPVVELATGVHIFRLLKREHAGQKPLDDHTQKEIRRKLENQIAEREYKRIVRELRGRSVVRIEK